MKIKCFGLYRLFLGKEIWLEIDVNETLASVLLKLEKKVRLSCAAELPFLDPKKGKPFKVLLNNDAADGKAVIKHGDEITIIPIIGGG